jgi:nicotinate-nucleotide pyrophosphorylase (carboxylating)
MAQTEIHFKDIKTEDLVRWALQEDLPFGDVTTEGLGLTQKSGRAVLRAKEDLILSGRELFEQTFRQGAPRTQQNWFFKDGQKLLKGQNVCSLEGNLVEMLKAERVALNFLGPLSGIATLTRKFVEEVYPLETKILDTRKTLPLYRNFAKKAVRDGGGHNHRMNLSDSIMIKDNHISMIGSLERAIEILRRETSKPIIVEVRTLDEVQRAAKMDVQRLLLDNMNIEMMKKAMECIPSNIETEASGNMTVDRVRSVAETGVTYISVGALTHSAPSADFSLLFDWV